MKLKILHESRELAFQWAGDIPVYKIHPSEIKEGEMGWYNPTNNTTYMWADFISDEIMATVIHRVSMPEPKPTAGISTVGDEWESEDYSSLDAYCNNGIDQGWVWFHMEASPGLQRTIWKRREGVPGPGGVIEAWGSIESAKALLLHLPNVDIVDFDSSNNESWLGNPRDFIELGLEAPQL